MPRRKRIDLEDYDFRPLPEGILDSLPGTAPADLVSRAGFIRDFTEPDADVSGFGGGSGLGDVPEEDHFAQVGGRSYQRIDYAPMGPRPVIAEFARPDSRYGVDPHGSDFGFPNAPVEFEPSGFEGLGSAGIRKRLRRRLHSIGNLARRLIEKRAIALFNSITLRLKGVMSRKATVVTRSLYVIWYDVRRSCLHYWDKMARLSSITFLPSR